MVKILLVDDDPEYLHFLGPILEEMGMRVYLAESGTSALQIVSSERPDVLITDVVMPSMSGVELIKKLKFEGNLPTTIVISGHPEWELEHKDVSEAISLSLFKPAMVNDVVDSIDICLNRDNAS